MKIKALLALAPLVASIALAIVASMYFTSMLSKQVTRLTGLPGELVTLPLILLAAVAAATGKFGLLMALLGGSALLTAITLGEVKPCTDCIPVLLALAVIYVVDRRLRLARNAARVSREYSRFALPVTALNWVGLVAGFTLFIILSVQLGNVFFELLLEPPETLGPLAPLLQAACSICLVRVLILGIFSALVLALARAYLEPIFFTLSASKEAVREYVENILSSEKKTLAQGKTWHQKLYASIYGHIAAFIASMIAYALVQVLSEIVIVFRGLLEGVPLPNLLRTSGNVSVIVGLASMTVTYIITYKIMSKYMLRAGLQKPARIPLKKIIALVLLLIAVISIIIGPSYVLEAIASPLTGQAPREPEKLIVFRKLVESVFNMAAESVRRFVKVFELIVSMLWG